MSLLIGTGDARGELHLRPGRTLLLNGHGIRLVRLLLEILTTRPLPLLELMLQLLLRRLKLGELSLRLRLLQRGSPDSRPGPRANLSQPALLGRSSPGASALLNS